MQRREFLRGLLIASVAVGVGKLIDDTGKVSGYLADVATDTDVMEAVKAQIGSNKFEPQSVLVDQGAYCKYFKITKEMIEDEEAFNELMDEVGIPDRKPDEIKIGYHEDDFEFGLMTVVLKYRAI